jgi:hypothetical protein
MLLIIGKALPNVRDAHVLLGSWARSTFPNLEVVPTLDALV